MSGGDEAGGIVIEEQEGKPARKDVET